MLIIVHNWRNVNKQYLKRRLIFYDDDNDDDVVVVVVPDAAAVVNLYVRLLPFLTHGLLNRLDSR